MTTTGLGSPFGRTFLDDEFARSVDAAADRSALLNAPAKTAAPSAEIIPRRSMRRGASRPCGAVPDPGRYGSMGSRPRSPNNFNKILQSTEIATFNYVSAGNHG